MLANGEYVTGIPCKALVQCLSIEEQRARSIEWMEAVATSVIYHQYKGFL